MKLLCLFFLVFGSLFGQIEPGQTQYVDLGTTQYEPATVQTELIYNVFQVGQIKVILFRVEECLYPPMPASLLKGYAFLGGSPASCETLSESAAEMYSAVDGVLSAFYSQFPDGVQFYVPDFRSGSAEKVRTALTTVTPAAPANPRMILLNGLGDTILAVDMTTFNTVSQVVVPGTTGPFAVRPATGSNEVWVANGGLGVSVVNLSSQSLVTTILTPSVPQGTEPVAGIAFTPDGTTAFEAIRYFSPDSSGNNGALLVFNAVSRTVTSTLPLKYGPASLVIAPDGLTAYLLSQSGQLTYYDVLSGTADLTVSTYPPGMAGGYGGSGPVFIHPDGTRLFWNINYLLVSFDLTTRAVTTFSSGLASTAAPTFSMSQDGGRVYFSDQTGDVVVMDTQFGNILLTTNTGSPTSLFGGPPKVP